MTISIVIPLRGILSPTITGFDCKFRVACSGPVINPEGLLASSWLSEIRETVVSVLVVDITQSLSGNGRFRTTRVVVIASADPMGTLNRMICLFQYPLHLYLFLPTEQEPNLAGSSIFLCCKTLAALVRGQVLGGL